MTETLLQSLAQVVWDWDPTLVRIGSIELRYYGVLFALALAVGYITLRWRYRDENEDPEKATNLTYALMIGIVFGARLGHCLFYEPERYLANPIEIFKFWQGGLASHGAATGLILVCLVYDWFFRRTPARVTLDRMALTIPFAMICVRLGNFFNSEIVGAPVDPNHPLAFIFVRHGRDGIDNIARYPSQLFEVAMGLVAFLILYGAYFYYKKTKKDRPLGLLSSLILIAYFCMRFFVEYFKERQEGELETGLHMGQILSIPFATLGFIGLAMCLFGPWKKQNVLQFTKRFQLPAPASSNEASVVAEIARPTEEAKSEVKTAEKARLAEDAKEEAKTAEETEPVEETADSEAKHDA
ncbi:MAG: prolipoprotein diacylglyceryl transferase [Proteobacteria bacterium]|nr:prolipoprotein diacylglyceryl transferase [Pseudomonadota bacterium]